MTGLPIDEVLPTLRAVLDGGTGAVLLAPPGAGKTTRVPLALLGAPWLAGGKIILLEPRRLAARAAAERMAALLGERVGETVGYRMRLETQVGARTRIEVVTEGVLTRLLQADAALEGVGLVIFDEFHERSVHADLGLALALQSRALLREDLRLLVMSATLEGEGVAALLGGAPVVRSEGRSHPVTTHYLRHRAAGALEGRMVAAVQKALVEEEGDVLVFLPGAGEIRRVERELIALELGDGVAILPLHGTLPQDVQNRALHPSAPGERKVVLATSIAETSLTIEGVRVVIDGGLMRVPRFSPRTGMSRLETVPVSRASADQRRGRAGRTGPGVCYRLWTEGEDRLLAPQGTPEILEADLAPLALELAAWGVRGPGELAWLDLPPAAAFAQAHELLRAFGALDAAGQITARGRAMAALGAHPRLAHMLLRGGELGLGALAAEIAALLGERDLLRSAEGAPDVDLRLRLELLRGGEEAHHRGYGVERGALARVRREAVHWRERLGVQRPRDRTDLDSAGLVLAFAYPDRVALRRPGGGGRFLLRNGRGAALSSPQALGEAPALVAAALDDQGRESRIFLAAPLGVDEIAEHFAEQIEVESTVAWDARALAVRARRQERLGALVLSEGVLADAEPAMVMEALLEGIRQEGLGLLPWSEGVRHLQRRTLFLRSLDPEGWPDLSDETLSATLGAWLAPYLGGARGAADLARLDLGAILSAPLSYAQRQVLEREAPGYLTVPSGSRVAIDYTDPAAPTLAVRLQEVFGLEETPRIGWGRVPLTLHLLSPARRPVQVTRDLASFWATTYFEVRKDLRGRYPKHYWPEDPRIATPTRHVRPR